MPATWRKRRSFGVTPLTPLFKPQNHFSQNCKYSFAPLGGTHGDFFSFSNWVSGRKLLCQGVSEKKAAFSPHVRADSVNSVRCLST